MRWIAALLLAGVLTSPLHADDIYTTDGRPIKDAQIEKATYEKVTYKPRGVSRAQEIEANRVERIVWQRNPTLKRGLAAFESGDYAEAEKRLKSAKSLANGAEKGYAHYMYGLCLYRQGTGGNRSKLDAAITELQSFVKSFKSSKDFYLPIAQGALADAYMATNKYSDAEKVYKDLAGYGARFAPIADMGRGKLLLVQGKFSDARKTFNTLKGSSALSDSKKIEAWLGYAKAQYGLKQYGPAGDTIRNQVVSKAKLAPIAAQGYLLWGKAELDGAGSSRTKQEWAAIRFMRAAILAGGDQETHIAALEGAKSAYEKLGNQSKVDDLKQRIARAKQG